MNVVFNLNQKSLCIKIIYHSFSCFVSVHTGILSAKIVNCSIIIKYVNLWKVMSFTNLKIVRIVSRSNLNNTSSEFLINIAVCDNRYLSICKWKVYFLSNKICISFIIRINSKCRITKKCLWTSSSYLYISSFFTNYRIIDMPEMSCLLLVFNLCI